MRVRQVADKFVAHVIPGVIRPLRILWNELMAFIFISLAAVSGLWVFRQVRHTGAPDEIHEVMGLMVGAIFAALMAYFGLSSLWKARKISRS
jgi:hypothetical protein